MVMPFTMVGEKMNVCRLLDGRSEGKRPQVESNRRREDYSKMYLRQYRVTWAGFIWLRKGTGGRNL
jgi:hypothetical protein